MSFEHGEPEEERYDKEAYLDSVFSSAPKNYYAFVSRGKMPLVLVPVAYRTPEICEAAVKNDSKNILCVPDGVENCQWLWEIAVRDNPVLFEIMPNKHKTKSVCEVAVYGSAKNLEHVPQEHMTPELVLSAVRYHPDGISHVPNEFLTKQLCLEAVRVNQNTLRFIPDMFKDYDVCYLAVRQDGRALRSVPSNLIDRKMCLAAIKNTIDIWYIVKVYYPDRQMLIEAAKVNWKVMTLFNEPDDEVRMAAFENSPVAILLFPRRLMTQELWANAIRRDPELMGHATRYIKDPYFYVELVQNGCRDGVKSLPVEWKEILVECMIDDPVVSFALHNWKE